MSIYPYLSPIPKVINRDAHKNCGKTKNGHFLNTLVNLARTKTLRKMSIFGKVSPETPQSYIIAMFDCKWQNTGNLRDNIGVTIIKNKISKIKREKLYFPLICTILWLLGSYLALKKVAFYYPLIDPDTSHSIMLWYGVKQHGWHYITQWRYTQDNWLLSVTTLHFILFSIFGPHPILISLTSWAMFVLSTIVSALIARQLGSRSAAWVVLIILIFSGSFVYFPGFIAYPLSHNTTNLYGLISLLFFLYSIEKHHWAYLSTLFIAQIVAGLSDPWFLASYMIPMFMTSIVLMLCYGSSKNNRGYHLLTIICLLLAIILVKGQLFGIYSFVPSICYKIGNWHDIYRNIILFFKGLSMMLTFIPYTTDNFIVVLLNLTILFYLIISTTKLFMKFDIIFYSKQSAFFLFVLFSIAIITLALIFSKALLFDWGARFSINIFYLIIIFLSVFIERYRYYCSNYLKYSAMVFGLFFFLSGVVSTLPVNNIPLFDYHYNQKTKRTKGIIKFLKKNGLDYGYGPYWGSSSNAITALTQDRIRIRPVVFSDKSGKMELAGRGELFNSWYLSSDFPKAQKYFFIIINEDKESCLHKELCIKGVIQQFGYPFKKLNYNDSIILVWDHPLIGRGKKQIAPLEKET